VYGRPHTAEPQAIFDYLYFHVVAAPRTLFAGVARLLPAHRLVFDAGRCTIERYWTPTFDESDRTPLQRLRDEFRTLLRDAIAGCCADTASLGCYLSGGTDSSTVAGMIGAVTGRPAKTYSIGFDVAGYDEMSYARIAARHFRTDHHEYYVTAADVVANVEALAASFDQPFGNSSVLPAFCCARLARSDGVTKLLAGDGGDELFGGNSRYATQRVFAAYERMPRMLRLAVIDPLVALPAASSVPLLRKAASYVRQARVPMPDRMEAYNLLSRIGIAQIFQTDFLAAVDTAAPLAAQRATYRATRAKSLVNRMLAYDWKFTLADSDLPKVIGSARAAGVAVGFPLLDQRLVDFSLRLAPSLKLRGLALRWFFKRALADFLPREIIAKKKHGFGLPFGAWALAHRELQSLAFDALATFRSRGIVRPAFIADLADRRVRDHPGYYGEMVWILMMLELWLRSRENTVSAAVSGKPATQLR
jgi:asparagine synthase (glutamine-hydrolysing)